MDDSEKSQNEALELLRSIKTVEDLEKHKDEILELVVGVLRSWLDVLKDGLTGSASPEEIQAKYEKMESFETNMKEELEKELDRIAEIPGAEDYVRSLQGEFEGRMGAIASEMSMVMMEVMSKLMGGMMGDAMGEMMQDMTYELPEGETIEALEFLKSIKSLDDIKEKKREIFEQIEKMYNSELESAKELKSLELSPEDIKEKVNTMRKRQVYIADEIEKRFDKLSEIDGGEEYLESLDDFNPEELFTNSIQPKVEELRQFLDELYAGDMAGDESWWDTDELAELYWLYESKSLEDLKENKDIIINGLMEHLENISRYLEITKDSELSKDDEENIKYKEKNLNRLDGELDKEFGRLKALPDAKEYVESVQKELMAQIEPIVKKIKELITEIKEGMLEGD